MPKGVPGTIRGREGERGGRGEFELDGQSKLRGAKMANDRGGDRTREARGAERKESHQERSVLGRK